MTTRFTMFCLLRYAAVVAVAAAFVGFAAVPAAAQSAEVRYQRALAREQAARKAEAPSVSALRAIATSYETIVRQFPRSGYSDNALWQAAGVLQLAWTQAGNRRDRDQALKLLQWLRKEYPASSFARQVPRQTTMLNQPRVPPTRQAAAAPRPASAPGSADVALEQAVPAATRGAAGSSRTADPVATAAITAAAVESRTAPDAVVDGTDAPVTPVRSPARTASASAPSAPGDAIHLRGISHTRLPRGDRITLELSREAGYSTERRDNPDQLNVVLTDADVTAALKNAAASIQGTLIQGMRLERGAGGLQLVVSLAGRPRHSTFPLYAPYRLVFDFETEAPATVADAAAPGTASAPPAPAAAVRPFPQTGVATAEAARSTTRTAAAPPAILAAVSSSASAANDVSDSTAEAIPATRPAPPASTSAGGYSLARQLGLGVSRIVIDPGHGGADPGAQANGVTEAALVLDVALRLEQLLKAQPGFEVVLTRRTQQAVALERRTAIANAETADLFLSIHANSSPRRETAGVETYFLNFASNAHAESVAARENASSAQSMRILPQLVRAITEHNKLAESREFAGIVQASLVRRLKARNQAFQDLGVKQAPFVVLIGAQMPSVLAEIAFLTNRAEASLLKQNAYKQQIAQALCDAILKYQSSLKKVTTVTASAEGR
jgi:N-acetylmuramoyl-L-alanine amidase